MPPPDTFELLRPAGEALPIVVDSPHSGSLLPDGFRPLASTDMLRRAEDAFVDRLYANAPAHGATLLAARVSRAYVDLNRAEDDLDAAVLDAPWPGPLAPTAKSRMGIGLVWHRIEGQPMYDRRLSVGDVRDRLDRCWRPYHEALQAELRAAYERFGMRWHLNVHSMPDDAGSLSSCRLADVVLGDRDGATADAATLSVIERSFRASGLSVARNAPFKGVEIVRASGDPSRGCHAVQIELKKSLYMDVAAYRPNAGFKRVQSALDAMLAALAAHVRRSLRGTAG